MKKIQLSIFYILLFNCAAGQVTGSTDTICNDHTVKFNKVKKSFKEANTAIMKLGYQNGNQTAVLKFEIPSFIFRLKTTLADYCVIETKTKKIKLQNIKGITAKDSGIISYYDFTFQLPRDSLLNILTDEIKKATFYFTPNADIKKYLNENRLVNKNYDKLMIRNSKKTIKYTISEPVREQYNQVLFCLNQHK